MITKICQKCKQEKPIDDFYKDVIDDPMLVTRINRNCKECAKEAVNNYREQRTREARELLLNYEQYMKLRKLASTKSGRAKLRQKNLTLAYRILTFIDKHP